MLVLNCATGSVRGDGVNAMPLEGEYEPSPAQWVRDQVELYESSGGTQGTTLWDTGLPVVILTTGDMRRWPPRAASLVTRSGTST